jgi:aromatic-L-amino-acid decarboxylase
MDKILSAKRTSSDFDGMLMNKTLDPVDAVGWAQLRAVGHRMLDEMFTHLEGLREIPVWQAMPEGVRHGLSGEGVPMEPQGVEAAYADFLRDVLPYSVGNRHPRFFGWVQGNGTPIGMLADMLASGMNANTGGFNQASTLVEQQVLSWLAQLMGMPVGTSGLLTGGGSIANLIGLVVARKAKAGFDVREVGLRGGDAALRVYCSTETHSWMRKSMELIGMGRASLASIPVDGEYRLRVDLLREAIAADRAAGLRPICVVGTAGTVNTGATDDLEALAELCAEEELWFHVDGAFGAMAYLVDGFRPKLKGMERADSLAFDLHKWGYLPFEVGCVLVRDAALHTATFATSASYLTAFERGPIAGGLPFSDRGIELTRGFKALKVWMSFKTHGVKAIAEVIEQNLVQAQYLAGLLEAHEELELMLPVEMNVVCFRFVGRVPIASDETLNRWNREIVMRVQERGIAVPSTTTLAGRMAIRVAIVNHRSRREDFDLLVESVMGIGREVLEEAAAWS